MVQVKFSGNEPKYAHGVEDAGADLVSTETKVIKPHTRALVNTGTSIELPIGYAAFVHPRSGLAAKKGVTVLNTPGTIDAGYRGEIKVILYNSSPIDFYVHEGDRIAQLVIQKVEFANFEKVETLDESNRGENGFGSTGVNK